MIDSHINTSQDIIDLLRRVKDVTQCIRHTMQYKTLHGTEVAKITRRLAEIEGDIEHMNDRISVELINKEIGNARREQGSSRKTA